MKKRSKYRPKGVILGGKLVKPYSDESPYLLFGRRMDALACVMLERVREVMNIAETIRDRGQI